MDFVKEKNAGQHLSWTIDRPERCNAIGLSIAKELLNKAYTLFESLQTWIKDDQQSLPPYRSLVLRANPTSKTKRTQWIAGGDLAELAGADRQTVQFYLRSMSRVCEIIENLPIPVIAAIDGDVIGGGTELALAADIRVCTKRSRFHFAQLDVGLPTGYGGSKRLVDLIGKSAAQEVFWLNRLLQPEDSLDLKLVHRVFDNDQALESWLTKYQDQIEKNSPIAVAMQKKNLAEASSKTRSHAIQDEGAAIEKAWGNQHHRKVLKKFLKGN